MSNAGQIIAIGGGGFGRNPNQPIIENYIIEDSMDYCLDKKTKRIFHPGVTKAVYDVFGNIPSHNGCWLQLKTKNGFVSLDL